MKGENTLSSQSYMVSKTVLICTHHTIQINIARYWNTLMEQIVSNVPSKSIQTSAENNSIREGYEECSTLGQ